MSIISTLDDAVFSIADLAAELEVMESHVNSVKLAFIAGHEDSYRINNLQHLCEYLHAAVTALDNANRATSEALKSACDEF